MSESTNIAALLDETVKAVHARCARVPRIGVVLGSGLGAFADSLEGLQKLAYADIPHIPPPRVVGHAGNLCFGNVGNVPVVCMQGRVHLYEGHPIWQVVHGVRLMARLGATAVLVTNAAGGLEASWAQGDLMIVTDHLNLMHLHPLIGPNDDALGTRFPDMTNAYDANLRQKLAAVSKASAIPLREGVYAGLPGPSYETPAEIRMLRVLGAQAVGMSTVPEVIALRHMRVPVAALSCITNLAAGVASGELDHSEVEATAKSRSADLQRLLRGWILAAGEGAESGRRVRHERPEEGGGSKVAFTTYPRSTRSCRAARARRISLLDELVQRAKVVRERAYAPHSRYLVGAAIATKRGSIFVGCNVENATFGATICAERGAIMQMIAAGEREPIACAVVTEDGGSPCGICRQVLVEFARDMPIALVGLGAARDEETGRVVRLADLLPLAFELLR